MTEERFMFFQGERMGYPACIETKTKCLPLHRLYSELYFVNENRCIVIQGLFLHA